MLVFPSRPPYRRHEPYQLLTPHAAAHHKRQCDVVSYARLLRLHRLKCTAGFRFGEQHGDHTRSSISLMNFQLLIRDLRPVGSVSQIGGQYPLCTLLGHYNYKLYFYSCRGRKRYVLVGLSRNFSVVDANLKFLFDIALLIVQLLCDDFYAFII